MYLHTPLAKPEYMFVDKKDIPQLTWDHFNLDAQCEPGDTKVYVKVTGGIYGLPQSGNLAQKQLISHLAKHGYNQQETTCLFRHVTRPIEFVLIVDDFGISAPDGEEQHLLTALRELYPITVDSEGKKYNGFTLDFDYINRWVDLSMPGYVEHALNQFNHKTTKNTHSPEHYTPITYGGSKTQLTKQDTSPLLTPAEVKHVQEVVGTFLWYARCIDGTMLGAINRIGSRQANATTEVRDAVHDFLNYAATWPNAKIRYKASDMILRVDGDASYLTEQHGRSRGAGHFILGTTDPAFSNHPIENMSAIIPTVVSSASEAEYATCFMVGQLAYGMRQTLQDLGHPQPANGTPITTDNSTAQGIATKSVKIKILKAIDMRYHWIRDRVYLKDFNVVWRAGVESIADFLTKAHPATHCLEMRRHFVLPSQPRFPSKQTNSTSVRSVSQ